MSVSSLTLGTFYEALIAFSSQYNFDQFTFDVCSGASGMDWIFIHVDCDSERGSERVGDG